MKGVYSLDDVECPHCHLSFDLVVRSNFLRFHHWVECKACGVRGPKHRFKSLAVIGFKCISPGKHTGPTLKEWDSMSSDEIAILRQLLWEKTKQGGASLQMRSLQNISSKLHKIERSNNV